MSHFNLKMNQLKQSIDRLTDDILEKISKNMLDDIDALLAQRHTLFSELMLIPMMNDDRKNMIVYINHVQQRDKMIQQRLIDERESVKKTLLKIGQLKAYTN